MLSKAGTLGWCFTPIGAPLSGAKTPVPDSFVTPSHGYHQVPVPTATMADYILTSIMDITNALQKPPPNSPLELLTKS